ncbi:MAG: DUF433 domain-containing protein [Planctomycetes bacterium]|nr:DUF433 domain-containing protein [Planctomycetota bacterium]
MVILHTDPLPLRLDDTGTIRVGATRVSLDVVLGDYRKGLSAEEIVAELDSLNLADVHFAISYYLRHRTEIDEYLRVRREQADELRHQIEAADPARSDLKANLTARLAQRNGGHAATAE